LTDGRILRRLAAVAVVVEAAARPRGHEPGGLARVHVLAGAGRVAAVAVVRDPARRRAAAEALRLAVGLVAERVAVCVGIERRARAGRAVAARAALPVLELARAARVAGVRVRRARVGIVRRRDDDAVARLAGQVARAARVRARALAADAVLAHQAGGTLTAGRTGRRGGPLRLAASALADETSRAVEIPHAARRADAARAAHVDAAAAGHGGAAGALAVAARRGGLHGVHGTVRATGAPADGFRRRKAARCACSRALPAAAGAAAPASGPRAVRIAAGHGTARAERRGRVARHALLAARGIATDAVDAEARLTLAGVVAGQPVADRTARSVRARVRRHAVSGPLARIRAGLAVGLAYERRAGDRAAAAGTGPVTVATRLGVEGVARSVAAPRAAHGGVVVELARARPVAETIGAAAVGRLRGAAVVGGRAAARDGDAGPDVVRMIACEAGVGARAVAADAVRAVLALAVSAAAAGLALFLAAGRPHHAPAVAELRPTKIIAAADVARWATAVEGAAKLLQLEVVATHSDRRDRARHQSHPNPIHAAHDQNLTEIDAPARPGAI